MKTNEDAASIAKKFRQGKADAVQYIYKTHYRPLCAFAGKMVGNQLEAEDIAIDSILKLLEKKERFETLSAINSFLYVSVRNACVDFLRAMQRRNNLHREIFYLSAPGEDRVIWEKDRVKIVKEIYVQVENLPPQCREVFKQLFYKRKSSARVARGMGISPQTVLNQKVKAIRFLRTALQKKELIHV
ncbi:MAG TPA: sigma-70 family RNA polymerase sigma factor [Chitinophagaceae bacterium]|jgi:RNA polymerase sigma-70 factor (ECF subfamily)